MVGSSAQTKAGMKADCLVSQMVGSSAQMKADLWSSEVWEQL